MPADSFRWSAELGRRLRELRASAGLTQNQLAAKMGRKGRNAGTLCARLESGSTKHPTLGLTADYLRACGVGFGHILGVLNRYTSRPPADETEGRERVRRLVQDLPSKTARQVRAYDAKTAVHRRFEHKEALPPGTRLARAKRFAAGLAEHDRVTELLRGLWPRLESPATLVARQAASNYVHRLWAGLDKTRNRSASLRARRVADIFVAALNGGELPEKDLKVIHTEVRELFRRLEQTRGTARRPAKRAARRLRLPERLRLPAELRASETAVAMAKLEVNRVLEAEKADKNVRVRWQRWLNGLVETGLHTGPGATERKACTDRLARSAPDPSRVADFAALFFVTLDRFLGRGSGQAPAG